eukprot:14771210-Alexandrium_andersonii.AAC.1
MPACGVLVVRGVHVRGVVSVSGQRGLLCGWLRLHGSGAHMSSGAGVLDVALGTVLGAHRHLRRVRGFVHSGGASQDFRVWRRSPPSVGR